MATFRKRGKRWQAQIRRTGYPPISKSFDLKADAEQWARDVERDMSRGEYLGNTGEGMTVAKAIEKYINEEVEKEKGAMQKKRRLLMLAKQRFATYSLKSLPAQELVNYRNDRLKTVSPQTVTHDLNALSSVYQVATREWGMPNLKNPLNNVRRPGSSRPRDRRLKPGEYEALRDAPVTVCYAWREVFIFAVETGMRRGEIASLRYDDINLELRIAQLRDTKNGETREVPLSSTAIMALRRLPRRVDGLLFGTSTHTISQAFRQARELSGACGLRFHDLRREAASRMFERGLAIQEVAAITGHKTLRTLLTVYTRLNATQLAKKLG